MKLLLQNKVLALVFQRNPRVLAALLQEPGSLHLGRSTLTFAGGFFASGTVFPVLENTVLDGMH
jgi:hypothetical protein